MMHVPVMAREVRELISPRPDGVYVDCTLGLGGHALALMEAAQSQARLIGIDKDPQALSNAKKVLSKYGDAVTLVRSDFRYLEEILRQQGLRGADGIVFDLGVSSPQVDEPSRGFSYLHDAPLDMRMDPCSAVSAYDIVNYSEAQKIERIIREYGEERWARRIARFIVDARDRAEIKTTYELVEIIKAAIPASARRRGPHPAKRTFQALRIVVNDELDAVAEGIEAGIRCLCDGAVLCVISFHSLEDRIAKHTFRRHAAQGEIEILTKKPLVPTEQEMEDNPRARSAKLRAVRRVLKAGEGE